MDSMAVSSNAQRRNQPCEHDPARDAVPNFIDQDRIRQEAARAAQQAAYQSFPVYPTTSIEAGVTTRTGGVPCLVPALRNERLPKDFMGPRKVPNYTADLQPGAWIEIYGHGTAGG